MIHFQSSHSIIHIIIFPFDIFGHLYSVSNSTNKIISFTNNSQYSYSNSYQAIYANSISSILITIHRSTLLRNTPIDYLPPLPIQSFFPHINSVHSITHYQYTAISIPVHSPYCFRITLIQTLLPRFTPFSCPNEYLFVLFFIPIQSYSLFRRTRLHPSNRRFADSTQRRALDLCAPSVSIRIPSHFLPNVHIYSSLHYYYYSLTPLCARSHRRLRSLRAECSRFPMCLDGMEPSSHSYNPVDKSSFGLPPIPIHLQDHTQLFTLLTLLIYTRHKAIARYSGYTSAILIRRPTH